MIIKLTQFYNDESDQLVVTPVAIQVETISCFYPLSEIDDSCVIVLTNGSSFMVKESFYSVQELMDRKNTAVIKKDPWIPCKEFLPDEDDDYFVSLGMDPFRSYSVDVDTFKHGKWKSYGKKVLAWMPFPDPYSE